MNTIIKYLYFVLFFSVVKVHGQDPHFTQANSSPMLVNPAYTGVFDNAQLRVMTVHRQQWSGMGNPFTTTMVGLDAKMFEDRRYNQNPFNVGMNLLSDKTFSGAVKSNILTASTSYHVPLSKEGKQTIGIGLALGYGTKRIDFSTLTSGSQFTSGGFDQSLSNGENFLVNIKPYFLISPGLLYTYNNREEGTFFDFGLAVYNANQPVLSSIYDKSDKIPRRISAQASFQHYMGSTLLFNAEMQYQSQAGVDYLLSGVSCAKMLKEEVDASMVGLGIWYRTSDAIAPYIFAELNRLRFGFTWDYQINDIRKDQYPANSIEFSLRWRIATHSLQP